MTLELYHNDVSVCAQKVRITLSEKNLFPVEHHLDLGAGDSHAPEYLKLNPKGVVPTLIDNENVIVESTVICEYLDDAYPDHPLRPISPVERAAMRQWKLVPDAGLHFWCSTVSFAIAWRHQDRTAQMAKWSAQVRAERIDAINAGLDAPLVKPHFKNYVGVLDRMEKALRNGPWLAGETYSLADIAVTPYVCRLHDMAQDWLWEDGLARRSIGDWFSRCRARKSFDAITKFNPPEKMEMMKREGTKVIDHARQMIAN